MGEPATLTIDELTWLSAATLIDNHYMLPESPMSEVSFRSAFYDAKSETGIGLEGESVGQGSPPPAKPSEKPRRLRRHRNFYKPPQHQNRQPPPLACLATATSVVTSTNTDSPSTPLQARGEGLTSPTPGANSDPGANADTSLSVLGKSITRSSEAGVQHEGQPITPPPTPPRRHMNPNHLSQPRQQQPLAQAPMVAQTQTQAMIEQLPTPSPPSPSSMPSPSPSYVPSTPSRTFYQPQGLTQPEWIYRRPKPSSPHVQNHAQLSRHNSVNPAIALSRHGSSLSLASSYSPSRSPSLPHPSPSASGSKRRPPIPCPSSPVLISSTSQLISVHPTEKLDSSRPCAAPSITANPNTSTSSLHLQSSIRVTPLKSAAKNRSYGAPPGNMSPSANYAVPAIERCPSNSSLMSTATNVSTSTAMWSAMYPPSLGKHTPGVERTRILKSIPSRSQIVLNSPVTPTFVSSPSANSSGATISADSTVSGSGTEIPLSQTPLKEGGWRSGSVTRSLPSPRPYLPSDKDTDVYSLSSLPRSPRRNKFASAPPAPTTHSGSLNPVLRPSPSTSLASSSTAKMMRVTSSSKHDLIPDRCSRCGTPKSRIRSPSLSSNSSIMTHTGTSTPEECEREGEIHMDTESILQSGISVSSLSIPLPSPSAAVIDAEYADQAPSGVYPHEHHFMNVNLGTYNDQLNGSTAVAARSQAYAKLTGKRHHSSTPPSNSVRDSANGHIAHIYKSRNKDGYEQGSTTTLKSISTSYFNSALSQPPVPSSSHCTSTYTQSPQAPFNPQTPSAALRLPPCQTYTPSSSLPKSKSILTRTSSMSTKNSACGTTTKSVKFVEVPVVHYRSKCYEEEYADVEDSNEGRYDVIDEMDLDIDLGSEDEDFSMKIEAIDMDIDTYLGICREKEKESKRGFMRQGSFRVGNILMLGGRKEKERNKEQEDKQTVADEKLPEHDADKGKNKEEKENQKSTLGLKKLMNLATRKASPTLSVSIGSPIPLGSKPSNTKVESDANKNITPTKKSKSSPPTSPAHRPTISGPYALGSCSPPPSRSRSPHASLPSPSPSPSRLPPHSLPLSPSDVSLNRLPSIINHQYHQQTTGSSATSHTGIVRIRSSSHRSLKRGKSKNGKMAGDVLSLNNFPVTLSLKRTPSYESFRSAKSYAGRSLLSDEVGSLKSAGESIRNLKAWVRNRMGTVGDEQGTAINTIENAENVVEL